MSFLGVSPLLELCSRKHLSGTTMAQCRPVSSGPGNWKNNTHTQILTFIHIAEVPLKSEIPKHLIQKRKTNQSKPPPLVIPEEK